MSLIEILLLVTCVLLFILIRQAASLSALFHSIVKTLADSLGQDFTKAQDKRDEIVQSLNDMKGQAGQLREDISDIAQTMQIIRKYKLPDRHEREELDKLAADAEFYRIVDRDRKTTP